MLLKELEIHVSSYEKLHTDTYAANVGWHIVCYLVVFVRIITAMKKLNLFTLQRRF